MQDAKDDHPIRLDAMENQVIAEHTKANAALLVTRNQRKRTGHISKVQRHATQLAHKGQCPERIIPGNAVTNVFKVTFRCIGEYNPHGFPR